MTIMRILNINELKVAFIFIIYLFITVYILD